MPVLVMLFDRQNEENLKFNLEKSYHKSIVETHARQAAAINIVGQLNLFYIEDMECNASSGEFEITNSLKFDKFSLIKRMNNKSSSEMLLCSSSTLTTDQQITEISTNFLPIGRYFMRINYRRILFTNDTQLDILLNNTSLEKESIVDLSLLPLAIRAQIIYEYTGLIQSRKHPVTQQQPQQLINVLAIDSHLLQVEINKKRDEMIREAIIKSSSPMDTEMLLLSASSKWSTELDNFIKSLEIDLNSYYICEKLTADNTLKVKDSDLVKLNRLDALASFKCVQKYKSLLNNVILFEKSKIKSASKNNQSVNRLNIHLIII